MFEKWIGRNIFIRTQTYHQMGVLIAVTDKELLLKGGTVLWIASDGRFTDWFLKGVPEEAEVYGKEDVIVNRNNVIDATPMSVLVKVVQK